MNTRNTLVLMSAVLFAITLTYLLFPPLPLAKAQVNTTSNVTINITIAEVAEITVTPTNLTITSISPGADSSPVSYSIKNTGSTNITNIFANVDTTISEPNNPLGTGAAINYSAGGLIFIRNASGGNFYHAGRLEWNITTPLTGEVLDLDAGTTNYSRGWYYNGSNTYLWKVENGTGDFNGSCNGTGTSLVIKGHPENSSSGLQRDFTSGIIETGSFAEGVEDWGLFEFTSGPWQNYCVAAYHTCEKVFIYKYDKRQANDHNLDGCAQSSYLREAILNPGDSTSFQLHASVPEGTPAGETSVSILTISAT